MTHRRDAAARVRAILWGLAGAVARRRGGCGSEQQSAPPPPPPPPPPRDVAPPAPDPVNVARVLEEMRPSDLVRVDEAIEVHDESLLRAVIGFADALARGDDAAFSDSLDFANRPILDGLLADGSWFEVTARLEVVRVALLDQRPREATEAAAADVVFALQEPGESYVLGWEAQRAGGGWVMSPTQTTDETRARASEWEGRSLADFRGSGGGSGRAGAVSGAAALDLNEPLLLYLSIRVSQLVAEEAGQALPEEILFSAIGAEIGGGPDRARELFAEGKAQVEAGELPEGRLIAALIDGLLADAGPAAAAAAAAGIDISREAVVARLATALNTDAATVERLYEEGKQP